MYYEKKQQITKQTTTKSVLTHSLNKNSIRLGVYWVHLGAVHVVPHITIVAADPSTRESCHMAYYRAIITLLPSPSDAPPNATPLVLTTYQRMTFVFL